MSKVKQLLKNICDSGIGQLKTSIKELKATRQHSFNLKR